MNKAIRGAYSPAAGGNGEVGQRLRALRIGAGLTQSQLAGGRFSKEYVSQIELGKTRPSVETLEWLAGQLDVEPTYLIGGVSAEERGRVEAALSRAEALSEQGEHAAAARALAAGRQAVAATGAADLELRSLLGETWALAQSGSVREALRLLERARDLAESPSCSDVDRAAVLFVSACAATTSPASRRRSLCSARRSSSPTARASPATSCGATSSTGVPAATAGSATGRRPGRTSNVRSSWRSPAATGAPPPGRTSRRRSWPSAKGTGSSPGPTRSGRADTTRSSRTGQTSAVS